jgi:serine/threonine protein kinase
MPEPRVGERFGGYLLEELAGEGSLATVYRARGAGGETVALKIFRQGAMDDLELCRRLAAEVRAGAIRHPHVVHVEDAGEADERPYLVIQYVSGPTLRALLRRHGRLDPASAATIVAQIADALDAAHAAGRVHRDVKPENILLERDLERPHAYLSDFTLSRDPAEDAATQIGTFAGFSAYVAPEIIMATDELDGRADVYSLGCVLFECLAGRVPFPGDDVHAILTRTSTPTPSVLDVADGLDPRWDEILARALAIEREERFATAGELGRAALAPAAPA